MGEGKYEHERYKTRSDDEQYGDDETARLCLFFLCELAFNEAKFITKGVALNMIEGRDITGVIKDLLQAASVGFKKLDNDLTYDSMTKREQDLYCAICLMATKAGLWTEAMSKTPKAELSDNHALLKKLTELGFDSQLSSRTQDSQEENAGGMFNATGVTNIINRLKNTKYEHTEAIVKNIEAEKEETVTPVTDDSVSSTGKGTSRVSSSTNGTINSPKSPKRKGDQSQSDIKRNDKGHGARNANDKKGASMSNENDVIPGSAGEEGGSKKTRNAALNEDYDEEQEHEEDDYDEKETDTLEEKKTGKDITVEEKEDSTNPSDPSDPIKTAIKQVVVNKGTDDSRYETIRDHTIDIQTIKDDVSLIFVVLPDTSKAAT
jgi:hypothetical protein